MIEALIYPLISDALAGTIDDPKRISPAMPAEGTELPFVIYYVSDDNNENDLDGPVDLHFAEFVCEAWAYREPDAIAVGQLIRDGLNGYRDPPAISRIRYRTANQVREEQGFHYDLIFSVVYKT